MQDLYNIKYKLRKFKQKYYTNMLLRGSLVAITLLILVFLVPSLVEYYAYFDETTRSIMFFGTLGIVLLVLVIYVVRPILKIANLGKTITDDEAARIIGDHFQEIKDKLLNTLQLQSLGQQSKQSLLLIEASIEQKSQEMKAFSFQNAINFRGNRKYLKFVLPVLLLLVFILVASPDLITEPSKRIVNYNVHFEKPAPFNIQIINENLTALQGDNFLLKLKTTGDVIPDRLYVNYGGSNYRMQDGQSENFNYQFSNLNENVKFTIQAEEYISNPFTLEVQPKPLLISFETLLNYPFYTGKADETIENNGELIVPEGTEIKWRFFTKEVDEMVFGIEEKVEVLKTEQSNVLATQKRIKNNSTYFFQARNQFTNKEDTLFYTINVIKDAYPDIIVEEEKDSSLRSRTFFSGMLRDDYGFTDLKFFYTINDENEKKISLKDIIDLNTNQQQFYYSSDFADIELKPGDRMVYYFEIWDNDAINGSKSTKSKTFSFRLPTKEEINDDIKEDKKKIQEGVEEKLIELNMLNQEIEQVTKNMLQKEKLDWQDQKRVEDLLNKQENLQFEIQELVKENKKANQRLENEDLMKNESLLEKQRQIQEMLDQILDKETKELMKKLQEMLKQMDKDKVMEMMEEIKMSNEEMEKNLDRNLEMLKQLEYEKMLNELSEKLYKLAEEQDKLANKTENKEKDSEQSLKEQENIKEKFGDLQEDVKELKKKNRELEEPYDEFNSEELEQEINQEMKNSLENLQRNKTKQAAESQKKTSNKMEKMSQAMMEMFNQSIQQQMGEDMQVIREILENLIETSFDQEKLIARLQNVNPNDPSYVEIMQKQNDIRDNLSIVEDSLNALAKRQMAIKSFVTDEISNIKNYLEKINDNMKDRRSNLATRDQQYVMTGVNNLALLLAEAMDQMKNSMNMQNSKSGQGSCTKPGGKGSSAKSLKQLQQQLNESMQNMQQGMQGKGQQGQRGRNSLSEQFARMAAEQASIRKKLQEYIDQLEEQGVKAGGMGELMEEMEKTEEELVNKILNSQTMNRQKEILTRLLKSEKAEIEREKKKEREAKEAKNVKRSNPENFLEYKRLKSGEAELLKTVNPKLKKFYQKRVNEYFYNSGVLTRDE